LERAFQHWRERGALLELPSHETARPMTVAISRECGSGGSSIAVAVADKLHWPLYDHELLEKIADDTGVHSALLENLDEKRPNWLAESLEGLSHEKHISGAGFAIRIRKILLALYCHGNCVVLGRGATQVLPSEQSLFVRLVAPLEDRIHRIAQEMHISASDARRHVTETDRGRTEFVRSYFNRDPTDPSGYDLVLNTTRFSEQDCIDLVLMALERRRTIAG
jgi:cytidylate kinase